MNLNRTGLGNSTSDQHMQDGSQSTGDASGGAEEKASDVDQPSTRDAVPEAEDSATFATQLQSKTDSKDDATLEPPAEDDMDPAAAARQHHRARPEKYVAQLSAAPARQRVR